MSDKLIPKQVQINGKWYGVSAGWAGTLNLSEGLGTVQYTASKPYITSDGYFVYDTNGGKVGEFHIGNRSCSGCVTSVDVLTSSSDSNNRSPSNSSSGNTSNHSDSAEGLWGCLGFLTAYFFFLLSNWGGRIGVILGIFFLIAGLIIEGGKPGNHIFAGVFVTFLFGTIGTLIGKIINFIITLSKK
jgi:hypothetical protein